MAYTLPEYLDRLAQFQCGVLSAQQAIAGGLTRDMIRARLRSRRWRKLQYGVYATFSGEPTRDAVLWAAVLRAGPGAALSYYTAAELYELIDWPSSAIHVTIPEQRRVAALPGIRIHIASRAEQATHPTLLPPRTRLEETVLDLACAARTADEACGWVTRGVGRGLTTQERLRRALGQRARVRFRAEIAEVLGEEWAGVNSPLEYRYVKWVELPHCLPRGKRQAAAIRAGRREYRDVLYEGYDLIVELTAEPRIRATRGGTTSSVTTRR
jgi:hypothetical protein